jgi:hypothetical protein
MKFDYKKLAAAVDIAVNKLYPLEDLTPQEYSMQQLHRAAFIRGALMGNAYTITRLVDSAEFNAEP